MKSPSELLQRWAPAAPGRRALVLGAGDGAEAAWLAHEGFRVEAVEKDPKRNAALNKACAGLAVTTQQADIEEFVITAGTQALIVALAVLHFISLQALPVVAGRIADGLAPGGLLLTQVLTDEDPSALARRMRGDPEPSPNTFAMEDGQSLIHYFTPGELPRLFSGLRHLEHERYRFAAPWRPDGFGAGEVLVAKRRAAPQN